MSEPEEEERKKKGEREKGEKTNEAALDTERSLTLFFTETSSPTAMGSPRLSLSSFVPPRWFPCILPNPLLQLSFQKKKETTSSWSRTLARSVFHSSFPSLGRLSPSPPFLLELAAVFKPRSVRVVSPFLHPSSLPGCPPPPPRNEVSSPGNLPLLLVLLEVSSLTLGHFPFDARPPLSVDAESCSFSSSFILSLSAPL